MQNNGANTLCHIAALRTKENKLQVSRISKKIRSSGYAKMSVIINNNFMRKTVYMTATADLKEEYDALFNRFKAQLAEYKVKPKTDKDGVAAFACAKWFEKIGWEREEIEGRF